MFHLFVFFLICQGAVASSAPINAQTDFPEYLEVSTDSLGTQECKDKVQAATTSVEKYVQTEAGRKMLTDLFQYVYTIGVQ